MTSTDQLNAEITELRAVIADLASAVTELSASVKCGHRLAYSVPQAAAMVGISDTAMRRLVHKGVLAAVPDTERVLIAHVELERWTTTTTNANP